MLFREEINRSNAQNRKYGHAGAGDRRAGDLIFPDRRISVQAR